MKYCPNCGKEIIGEAKFCINCGKELEKTNKENIQEKTKKNNQNKCPNCGEPYSYFDVKCKLCGYELQNKQNSELINNFIAHLNYLEQQRYPQREEKKADKSNIMTAVVDRIITDKKENNKIMKHNKKQIENQIYSYVQNFVIPTGKGDLFEFIMLASTRKSIEIDSDSEDDCEYYDNLKKIWSEKYNKASIIAKELYSNDPDFSIIFNEIKRKNKKTIKMITMIIPLAIFALIIIGGGIALGIWNENKVEGNPNDPNPIKIGYSNSDLEGMNYQEVESILRAKGFVNITTIPIEDLITGWITKDGEVERVMINGNESFSSSKKYSSDIEIIIFYHTFSTDKEE